MEYKVIAFDPPANRAGPAESAATALEGVIGSQASSGWEFIGLENHSTIVPGSSGCFGFGATSPYPRTVSLAVFRK